MLRVNYLQHVIGNQLASQLTNEREQNQLKFWERLKHDTYMGRQ